MGEQVGGRAQTTSFRKENELRRGMEASQTGCELKEGSGKDDSTFLPGQQLAICMSQANAVEPSSFDAIESGGGEQGKCDENGDSNGEEEEGGEGDEKGNGSEGTSGSGKQDSEEVVEVRPSAKARCKAKSGPSDKMAVDDMSKPYGGGPINQEISTSFNNHVAAAIWNKKVVAEKQINQNDSITLNYGCLSNDFFLLDYGFVITSNPFDRIKLKYDGGFLYLCKHGHGISSPTSLRLPHGSGRSWHS
ncbi:hypothetical protein Syun_009519 [Stephania yunnanensis]|uniref:SET domain-containing protein n=1 Tax=Stephania yunnanensis TaxID=152371 RepID=A0AAP0PQY0_9MAGN